MTVFSTGFHTPEGPFALARIRWPAFAYRVKSRQVHFHSDAGACDSARRPFGGRPVHPLSWAPSLEI